MSVLNKLTEGIVNRDLQKEGAALLNKWEKTGLLEGINSDSQKNGMARLLENQAKELLREASTMASGDVEGFAAVAFPLVRRVFGGLIANDLVSVQPMSLPSGLIFFLDFTFTTSKLGNESGDSLYGGGVVGHQITGGVQLGVYNSGTEDGGEESFYALNNGYSSPTASIALLPSGFVVVASGTVAAGVGAHPGQSQADVDKLNELCRFDPDLSGTICAVFEMTGTTNLGQLNLDNLVPITPIAGGSTKIRMVRRLSTLASGSAGSDPSNEALRIQMVVRSTGSAGVGGPADLGAPTVGVLSALTGTSAITLAFPITDNFNNVTAEADARGIGAVVGADTWGLENNTEIPEIDIKVDSVSVTARTKKLKAKWTPELGQDLNAYHNLDAEVELTGILSEQIALEIDREILEDLIVGSQAGTLYWSRNAGKFVNRETGKEIGASTAPDFTGTVSEWYETLCETINDVSARIHRKTLRGGANFIVCGPEVANILEFTSGFRADVTGDADRGTVGAVKVGNLSKKWDVYVDPYFPRNVVLAGRKGGSFLESGYVYAPYVPLQVTPTIFGTEDFVPRKGVMTRYAKKMVRPDMYGLVIVEDLIG